MENLTDAGALRGDVGVRAHMLQRHSLEIGHGSQEHDDAKVAAALAGLLAIFVHVQTHAQMHHVVACKMRCQDPSV